MKLLPLFARPASAGALASVLALALVLSAPLARAADDPVVARVNGTDVRASDLAMAEEDLGGNIPQMAPEAKRDYLITFVTDMMLVAKAAVTDAELRKVYDEAIGQMKSEPEVRARHILVETEDEAKAVVAELKKGADFAELAKAKSKDPGSADGGDLGYFTKDQMVPEFSEVAFKLEKGQLS